MRTVYHLWLSPFCRKVRIVLAEKGLEFDMQVEKLWERRDEFLALNPAGDLPVLIEEDGLIYPMRQPLRSIWMRPILTRRYWAAVLPSARKFAGWRLGSILSSNAR